jgi:hypothetical protein
MRLAFATLAVVATTSIGVFIDGLARNGAPGRQAYVAKSMVVAKGSQGSLSR